MHLLHIPAIICSKPYHYKKSNSYYENPQEMNCIIRNKFSEKVVEIDSAGIYFPLSNRLRQNCVAIYSKIQMSFCRNRSSILGYYANKIDTAKIDE